MGKIEIENYLNLPKVRLVKNEMLQLENMEPQSDFFHVNLQHSTTLQAGTKGEDSIALEIIKNGKENILTKSLPDLDYDKAVLLKLEDIKISIPVSVVDTLYNSDSFLLADNNGLYESLCTKYMKVTGLNREKILRMDCYIRRFKIVKFL